jgi:hypothetical protein
MLEACHITYCFVLAMGGTVRKAHATSNGPRSHRLVSYIRKEKKRKGVNCRSHLWGRFLSMDVELRLARYHQMSRNLRIHVRINSFHSICLYQASLVRLVTNLPCFGRCLHLLRLDCSCSCSCFCFQRGGKALSQYLETSTSTVQQQQRIKTRGWPTRGTEMCL